MRSTRELPSARPGRRLAVLALAGLLALPATLLAKPSLTPTRPALLKQVYAARDHEYSYLTDEEDVFEFARKGYLVELRGNRDYVVKYDVTLPYARPEVKIFLERLSAQYREACGEKLVVTSLVRPKERQPRNSSPLSVHPTGIAIDLRIPANGTCRAWLESAFLNLEAQGLLEAARERRPPHYHVVLIPNRYTSYLARVHGVEVDRSLTRVASLEPAPPAPPDATSPASAPAPAKKATAPTTKTATAPPTKTAAAPPTEPAATRHTVKSGENLWLIARRYGTSVAAVRAANDLGSNALKPGQVLTIERGAAGSAAAASRSRRHEVRSGENLWVIARRYDTTVAAVRAANGLGSSSLRPGQVLTIPAAD